jgi:aspartyl/asparaginyl-tRNA synthetase
VKATKLLFGVVFLLGAVAVSIAVAQDESGTVRPEEVGKDHVGKKIAVEGRVYSNSKSEAGIHLYFAADTSTAFQAIVSAKSVYKFQVDVAKKYDKRNVRVTGKVEEEAGKFFIRIDDPSQIKVVPRKMS